MKSAWTLSSNFQTDLGHAASIERQVCVAVGGPGVSVRWHIDCLTQSQTRLGRPEN
jgi:hypothetical protein